MSDGEGNSPVAKKPRYVLYDFDADELASTQLFDTYAEAVEETDRLQNILIIPIHIPATDDDLSDDNESA